MVALVVTVKSSNLINMWDQKPTTRCAAVISKRAEATLAYSGALVLDRDKHEGPGSGVGLGVQPAPWAGQDLAVRASEKEVFSWYTGWLSSHGWSRTRESNATDSDGTLVAHYSSWERGVESFDVSHVVSADSRARFPLTDDQLLITTEYISPAGVLGCQ